jgi:hypothetical protein
MPLAKVAVESLVQEIYKRFEMRVEQIMNRPWLVREILNHTLNKRGYL